MAQKVQVLLLDDVDGTDADETISFSLEGAEYEIDLNNDHAAELRDVMASWIGHARRTGGRGRVQNINARRPRTQSDADLSDVRSWARQSGYQVSDRGRVSTEIMEAFRNRNKVAIPEAAVTNVEDTSVEGVDQPQEDNAHSKPAPKTRARKGAASKVSA